MKFSVQNMKCSGCVTTVTETLRELTDSKLIEVNLEEATAEIDEVNDPETVIAVVIPALAEKGFPASII